MRIHLDLFLSLLLTLLFLFFLSNINWLLLSFLLEDLVSLSDKQLFGTELLLDSCNRGMRLNGLALEYTSVCIEFRPKKTLSNPLEVLLPIFYIQLRKLAFVDISELTHSEAWS